MAKKKIPNPKFAVIYARYSSSAQNDASIEQQVDKCTQFADARGIRIVAVYDDHAISGKTDRRPAFQRMMKDASSGLFDGVIAWKSNRMGRNMLEAMMNDAKLAACGIRCMYVEEDFDDSAAGRFALRNMMNVNQFYSENMSEDIARGMEANARECKVNGPIPLGYCKGADGRYEVNEAEAAVVREIFMRAANGEMLTVIAEDLNRRQIRTKTGGTWRKGSFNTLIRNERYTGVYIFGEVRIDGGIPAIINRELFESVQNRMNRMSEVKSRRRREKFDYILTGKLYCGLCGTPMTGATGTSKTGKIYAYYRCRKNAEEHECTKKPIRKEVIEKSIAEAVKRYVLTDEVIEQMADLVMEYKARCEKESETEYLKDRLREAQTAKKNLMKSLELGIVAETVLARIKELEIEEKDILAAISREQRKTGIITRDHVVFYFEQFRSGDIEDEDYQAKLIKNFVRSVYVYDDHITITFDFSEDETKLDIPTETAEDGNTEGESVLIRLNEVYHFNLIRTPSLKMIGRVFFLTVYFNDKDAV